jgi:hypothetical protein
MFDEQLRRCEDFEMWCRLAASGSQISYHQRIMLRYRIRAGALSKDSAAMYHTLIKLHDKFLSEYQLSQSERELVLAKRTGYAAELALYRAEEAILNADFAESRRHLRFASGAISERRRKLLSIALHSCPSLVRWAYLRRRRLS